MWIGIIWIRTRKIPIKQRVQSLLYIQYLKRKFEQVFYKTWRYTWSLLVPISYTLEESWLQVGRSLPTRYLLDILVMRYVGNVWPIYLGMFDFILMMVSYTIVYGIPILWDYLCCSTWWIILVMYEDWKPSRRCAIWDTWHC